ncbi:hypothetical protein [Paenibacillus spongiae]|uniref:Uncharacterized protein n=1 Tax=Paenibacillus spongiae TaxID=2909671 RepID=A0ABY5SCC5_9BACL|nr:hypothetical protein [Paenibacillus spongiae]UVI31175.1 hypothetical protein L1F29_04855 [Paenibacillus spongiae]
MRKVTGMFVTIEEIPNTDLVELIVVASDDHGDIFVTKGFDTIDDCYEYARIFAKGIGLSEENIDGDVFDRPKLTLVK